MAIYQATERFGTPSGVFTIQEMMCQGTEDDIENCPVVMGSSCSRQGDVAGVFCFNTPASGKLDLINDKLITTLKSSL